MRPSLGKSCLAVLRSIVGLTQGQLAELADVSRPTIQAIELGKLTLSRRLAEKISLHTGVSMRWLLNNRYKVLPTCEREPARPYTNQIFEWTRAEIEDPRTEPGDCLHQYKTLETVFWQLGTMLLKAYRDKKTVYFQHKLRLFLEDLVKEFPQAADVPLDSNLLKMSKHLWQKFNATAKQLAGEQSKPSTPSDVKPPAATKHQGLGRSEVG